MLYDYLSEFSVVANEGAISAAADKLNISQPSLGRHITALEADLGVKLLQRGPAGVHLTDEGRIALDAALDIEALERVIVRHFSSEERRLRERRFQIGLMADVPAVRSAFLSACSSLNERGYNVTPRFLQPNSPEEALPSLERRDVDVVVGLGHTVQGMPPGTPYACFELGSVPAAVAAGPAHPLWGCASLRLDDVREATFVRAQESQGFDYAVWRDFCRMCDERGFSPQSQTLYYDNKYGYEIFRPEQAVVVLSGGEAAERYRLLGRSVTAIEDCPFALFSLVRADDALACELAGAARDAMGSQDVPEAVSHQSMYGALAKAPTPIPEPTAWEREKLCARVLDEPPVTEDLVLPDGTVVNKAYVALRNRLNRLADGLGNTPLPSSFEAIMNLWTVEEAQAELEMPLLGWFTAYDYSVGSGRDLGECERLLESLAARNLIYRVNRGGVLHYCLLAWVYGIWEFAVQRYDEEFLGWGIYGADSGGRSRYPIMHACPVNAEVIEGGQIAPYRDWRSYIERQATICLAPCQCRRSKEVSGMRVCTNDQHPVEACLTFGEMAEYWLQNGSGRRVDVAEALAIADAAVFEHGLVPQLYFSQNPEVMCLCHSDCCLVLAAIRATGGRTESIDNVSAYTLACDPEACIGCGACVSRCPMEAVSMDGRGACAVDATCVACGQCALVCPSGARVLVPKDPASVCDLPADWPQSYAWRSADRMAKGQIVDFVGTHLDAWTVG